MNRFPIGFAPGLDARLGLDEASSITHLRLVEPTPSPAKPKGKARRACRREVKATLKRLRPERSERDVRAAAWVTSRCGRCMLCAKFMAKRGIMPQPSRPR